MNKVILIGRLVKENAINFTKEKGTAVVQNTLAVENYNSSTKEKGADFIQIVVWGKQAENMANFTDKGDLIMIQGKIKTRSYEAKDGTKKYITEVVADMQDGVKFLNVKKHATDLQEPETMDGTEPF